MLIKNLSQSVSAIKIKHTAINSGIEGDLHINLSARNACKALGKLKFMLIKKLSQSVSAIKIKHTAIISGIEGDLHINLSARIKRLEKI